MGYLSGSSLFLLFLFNPFSTLQLWFPRFFTGLRVWNQHKRFLLSCLNLKKVSLPSFEGRRRGRTQKGRLFINSKNIGILFYLFLPKICSWVAFQPFKFFLFFSLYLLVLFLPEIFSNVGYLDIKNSLSFNEY